MKIKAIIEVEIDLDEFSVFSPEHAVEMSVVNLIRAFEGEDEDLQVLNAKLVSIER